MAKPENSFIHGIKYHLPHVYAEKMNNPYRAGTADMWYSGTRSDIWIEYKYISKIPKNTAILPDLTLRQQKWLKDRHAEGRNVAVILGCPNGGVVYTNLNWLVSITPEDFQIRLKSRTQIARWIFEQTGASPCTSSPQSVP